MDANEAKAVATFLVADFENEMNTTLRVLAAVPANKLDFQPDAKSKTAIGLVRHIALEDAWLLEGVANGVYPPPPDDSDACGIADPAQAVARYQESVPVALGKIRAMTGEQLLKVVDLLGVFQLPAIQFLSIALKHSVHHRGQLSTYLRPMGGKVPGIYGPTADTQ